MIKDIVKHTAVFAGMMLFASGPAAQAGILQTFDFETGDLSQLDSTEIEYSTASVTVSTAVARRGTYSMKAYIQTADKRAEGVSQLRGTVGGVNWYGWSIYVPADYAGDGLYDIVSQFHDWHTGIPAWAEDGKAPTNFNFTTSGNLQLDLKYQSAPQTVAHKSFTLGAYTRGAWHDIVVNVKWTYQSTGFMKVWLNGVLKVDYTGPTYMDYGAGNGPYFKMGDYKGVTNWPGTSPRYFYMDEFRMGDANSSYDEVNPATCKIVNNYTSKALRPYNAGTGDNTNIVQDTYHATWTSQQWQVASQGNGYYAIVNNYTGKSLRPLDASTASGASIVQYTYNSSWQSEQWQLIPNGAGYYGIENRYSGLALRPLNAGTGEDVQIVQEPYNATWTSMKWQTSSP